MGRKLSPPEQNITMLREAEVVLSHQTGVRIPVALLVWTSPFLLIFAPFMIF
jgi:hypothetical protein